MKRRGTKRVFGVGAMSAIAALLWASSPLADPIIEKLTLLVPARSGSGWDLTARAMADAMIATDTAGSVEIEYSPGAGGVVGLAQFVSSRRGQGDALLIGGRFTVGSVQQNQVVVSLLDTTPLARLTFDQAVLAVPLSSKILTVDDLIEAMVSAPESVSWVGGSLAGVDHINIIEIAQALGIAPSRVHYTGLPGGADVADALTSGRFAAGISGFSEFETPAKAGQLRMIAAVTARESPSLSGLPSLGDLGITIKRFNWRGVFAPPDIDAERLAILSGAVERMVRSHEWQEQLHRHHWRDAYLAGGEFGEFLIAEREQVAADLALMKTVDSGRSEVIANVLARRYVWALALAAFSVVLIGFLFYQRSRAHRVEVGLQHAFEEATGEAALRTEELEKALAGIHAQIEREFEAWNLTAAEREIALLLLKGLRLKEIAAARGTSERTVRQQAQAIYKKAGLDGRSDLAAFFIEDFMLSIKLAGSEAPPQESGPSTENTG